MRSSILETRIPSDMCSPTWETGCPTRETHISSVICSLTCETHIPSDLCSLTWKTHIPSGMCSQPSQHMFLVICVSLPAQHMCIVIRLSLPGKHISLVTWVVLPIEIKKSRWQRASHSLQVQDWLSLSSILTADLWFEYMDIRNSKKRPWRPSFLSLSTSFCRGIHSSKAFLKSTKHFGASVVRFHVLVNKRF